MAGGRFTLSMKVISARFSRLATLGLTLQAFLSLPIRGQPQRLGQLAVVQGTVSDSESSPLKDVDITLESADHAYKFVTRSDAQGRYLFNDVPPGTYTLRCSKPGYLEGADGPFAVSVAESKIVDGHLSKADSPASAKDARDAGQFSDEPQFQIAGIADPTNYGGHGSGAAVPTKEALAKDADALNREAPTQLDNNSGTSGDAAEMHRRKGDAAEKEGRSLEAVREYQVAAQLQPSEANLFAWGGELLLHRAYEPAIEVFGKGRRLFPNSVRMAIGLSIATYNHGATKQSAQLLVRACDINPGDPTPYLFMGRLEEAERIELPGWTEKLHRFSLLAPDNSLAHYYYAVALSKQNHGSQDHSTIEAELKRAIELDPKLGEAYLQLGILYAAEKDTGAAIAALEKAIGNSPLPDEAHYRLAQIYRQTGNEDKAREEISLYEQTSQQRTRKAEEQHREIQQFIYTLGGQKADGASAHTKPH